MSLDRDLMTGFLTQRRRVAGAKGDFGAGRDFRPVGNEREIWWLAACLILYGAEGHLRPTVLRGGVLRWRADGMMVVGFFSGCLDEA